MTLRFIPPMISALALLTLTAPAALAAAAPATAATPPAAAPPAARDCPECPEMITVPAGNFQMGDAAGNGFVNEKPPRKVVFAKPFAIGKSEVTFKEWDACVADNGCKQKPADNGWGRDTRPAINVSWADAQEYVAWLSKKTGKKYRLPSEAEWEYAARAGTATDYAWGNELGSGKANCDGCGSQWDMKQTAPVGSFPANAWGLTDVQGNVAEWTQDCYREVLAMVPADGSAVGGNPAECLHTIRGGSWLVRAKDLRVSNRSWLNSINRFGYVGFRVAKTLE